MDRAYRRRGVRVSGRSIPRAAETPQEVKEFDAELVRLGVGFGYLTDSTHSGLDTPERFSHASASDILMGLRHVLESAGHKIDGLAHEFGGEDGQIMHPELEFIAEALVRISRGHEVPENPFMGDRVEHQHPDPGASRNQ